MSKKIIIIGIIILLILVAGIFAYNGFIKPSNYIIENKYYGFVLQVPKNWIAKQSTLYNEDFISEIITEDKSSIGNSNDLGTQIGALRFESSNYPDDFIDSGKVSTNPKSGAILEIDVYYKPYTGIGKISNFINIKNTSFNHNDFQYKINGYVYVSPNDKNKESSIRNNYQKFFDRIISSFRIMK